MSLQLAEQFEANEQYEQAYEEYKREYQHNPDDVGIVERLGHLSLILEKKDEAANYYYEILRYFYIIINTWVFNKICMF